MAAALVQSLGHADDQAVLVDERRAQDRASEEPSLLVKARVKAQIGVGVGNVDRLASGEHGAGDAGMVGKADFVDLRSHCDAREQLLGLFVMEEQGRPLRPQHPCRLGHHSL